MGNNSTPFARRRAKRFGGTLSGAREADERSRLVGLALRPEPRPTARRPPTRSCARGDEPRRTEFDLQGQHFVGTEGTS
jgi:hypothetical protein